MSKNSIIFTYNADSGFVNLMKDVVHRVASPGTYPCNLCKVNGITEKIIKTELQK